MLVFDTVNMKNCMIRWLENIEIKVWYAAQCCLFCTLSQTHWNFQLIFFPQCLKCTIAWKVKQHQLPRQEYARKDYRRILRQEYTQKEYRRILREPPWESLCYNMYNWERLSPFANCCQLSITLGTLQGQINMT